MHLLYMMSVLILMLTQASVLALGYSKSRKRGASFLIWLFSWRFSFYMFPSSFSAQRQVDLGCWTGWEEVRCCTSTPCIALVVPRGSGRSCAMQVSQDYVCRVLSGSLSSPVCVYLDKLLYLSCRCFGLQSSQGAFPQEAEGEIETQGETAVTASVFGVPAHLPRSSPWSGGNFLISRRTGWITDCKEQKCLPLSSPFPLPLSHVLDDYPDHITKTSCTCSRWGV